MDFLYQDNDENDEESDGYSNSESEEEKVVK